MTNPNTPKRRILFDEVARMVEAYPDESFYSICNRLERGETPPEGKPLPPFRPMPLPEPETPKTPAILHHPMPRSFVSSDPRKQVQSKDVPELPILRALAAAPEGETFNLVDILNHRAGYPVKVVKARLDSMIRRKLIRGCTCGCRGDFSITPEGRAALTAEEDRREYRRVS